MGEWWYVISILSLPSTLNHGLQFGNWSVKRVQGTVSDEVLSTTGDWPSDKGTTRTEASINLVNRGDA